MKVSIFEIAAREFFSQQRRYLKGSLGIMTRSGEQMEGEDQHGLELGGILS